MPNAVVSFTTGTTRNNYSDSVGMRVLPNVALTVTALGRYKLTGNSQVHTLTLANAAGVTLATVTVDMSTGSVGSFVYGTLATPVVLTSGSLYFVVSSEVSGGDIWYEQTPTTLRSEFTSSSDYSAYVASGTYNVVNLGYCYGPVDLTYTVGTARSGTASITLGTLTASGAATHPVTGASSVSLDAIGASSTGTHPVTGSASPSLDPLASSSAGGVRAAGSGSITLDDLAAAASGSIAVTGTTGNILDGLGIAAIGTVLIAGESGSTLDDSTLSSSGGSATQGDASEILEDLQSSSTGTVLAAASFAKTLDDLLLVSFASEHALSASITLDPLVLSSASSGIIHGSADIYLGCPPGGNTRRSFGLVL